LYLFFICIAIQSPVIDLVVCFLLSILQKNDGVITNSPCRIGRFPAAFVVLLLVLPLASSAQLLNLQLGASFSKLNSVIGRMPTSFLDQTRIDPSVYIGVEYLENKYWSISTNLGYVRKGGKEPWSNVDSAGNVISTSTASETFNYLSVNTLFNFKYPIRERWTPFIGVGPRMDFLISHDHTFQYFDNQGILQKKSYGVVAAVGVRGTFSTFLLGVRAEHLYNYNHLASDGVETNNTNTSIISLTIGSRFGRHRDKYK
jgi:hypothetical protein